jgi:hypothetical protein
MVLKALAALAPHHIPFADAFHEIGDVLGGN